MQKPSILAISIMALLSTTYATADISTDKSVGNCVAYLAAQGKESGMKAALNMADNQKRAMQFADAWLKQAARFKNRNSIIEGMAYSADSDCRDIGIRPLDY